MKRRTKMAARAIGAIMLLLSLVMGIISMNMVPLNGATFAMIFFLLVGAYLLLASEKSLKSWLFWKK